MRDGQGDEGGKDLASVLSSFLSWLMKFVDKYFKEMPAAVQVVVFLGFSFLVLLFGLVFAIEITASPFVEGKIWVLSPNSPLTYGSSFVLTHDDRRVVANEFGSWAIKANRRLPGKIRLEVANRERALLGIVYVSIPIPIWSTFVSPSPVDIVYEQASGKVSLATAVILFGLRQGDVQSQAVQQQRPFTIGVTSKDASMVPLILAQEALDRGGMPVRIVSIDREVGPFALRVREIDLLYTDGVSALMGALRGPDLVFVAGALEHVTGSLFSSPGLVGFSDPKVKVRAVGAVLSHPSVRTSSEVTFEALALRAILRANGISRVFVLPSSEPLPEAVLLEQILKELNGGGIDFAYLSAERVLSTATTKAKELKFGLVPLQGVLMVARKSDVDSNRDQLLRLLKGFSDGTRAFSDPKRGPKALQEQLRLDVKGANSVYGVYKARGAFKAIPAPNPASVANLIQELARIVPEAKKLSAQALIDLRVLKALPR